MRRAERAQIGCALLVVAGGLAIWAAGEFFRRTEGEDSQWPLLVFLAPAFCLVITGIWFMHK